MVNTSEELAMLNLHSYLNIFGGKKVCLFFKYIIATAYQKQYPLYHKPFSAIFSNFPSVSKIALNVKLLLTTVVSHRNSITDLLCVSITYSTYTLEQKVLYEILLYQ